MGIRRGGAPSPCSGQKKDSAGDGEEQAYTGHDENSEQQSRRVLRRTTAPTRMKFRRIDLQVTCAKSVPFRSSARKRYDCVALRANVTTASSSLMACDSVSPSGTVATMRMYNV